MRLICLDIETSGLLPAENYLLLSIATKDYNTGEQFYAEVDFWCTGDQVGAEGLLKKADPQAFEINQLQSPPPEGNIRRFSLWDIDKQLSHWLVPPEADKGLIPMGLNVGGFDLAYMRLYLPKSAKLLGYQTLELNSLFIEKYGSTWRENKKNIEQWALKQLQDLSPRIPDGVPWRQHSALFDVWLECFMLAGLRQKAAPWMEED